MPTLNWIEKEAVVNHHRQVPFHLLKDVSDLACAGCLLGRDWLQAERIIIRQTPYEIKVS